MTSKPAVIGGFILGAVALGVAAILFFGGTQFFSKTTRAVVFFNESVAGLEVGAPVTFRGVRIGSVQSIAIRFTTDTMTARIPVIVQFDKNSIIWQGGELDGSDGYRRLIGAGLRAQLTQQSFVTGQLRVDLSFRPGTTPQLIGSFQGLPEIPSVPSDLDRLRNQLTDLPLRAFVTSAEQTLGSLQKLSDHLNGQIDPLAASAQRTADAATDTLRTTDEAVQKLQLQVGTTLTDVDALVVDARRQLGARGTELSQTLKAANRAVQQMSLVLASLNDLTGPRSDLRGNLEAAARDLSATTSSLRGFAATIERNPNTLLLGRGTAP